MRGLWFIASRDLTFLLRQKETLLWVFLMPFLFFYFIGTVTGGFGSPSGSEDRPDPLALRLHGEGGFLVDDELVRRLEEQDFAVVFPPDDETWSQHRRRLEVPAPPAGYATLSEAILGGEQAVLVFERSGEGLTTSFDELRVSRAVYTVLADLAVTSTVEGGATPEAFASLGALPRALTLRVEPAGKRVDPPVGFDQAVPGTMVMFTMLVLLTSGAILLVIEREEGLLRRLASTPISALQVVWGKWTARMALALTQIAFALVVGRTVFRVNWGESVGVVLLVLFAWAGVCASLALLLGSVARSQGQVAGIGVLSTMLLASLGGCWWPIEVTPAWMQRLSLFLPTGWTMDALHRLVNFGYGPESVVGHVVGLLLLASALAIAGAKVFRYQ